MARSSRGQASGKCGDGRVRGGGKSLETYVKYEEVLNISRQDK